MVNSGRAARLARHHKRHRSGQELNLVSLIDIFSVLVFFLIVNFGDLAVVNMNLPVSSDTPIVMPKEKLQLEITVRSNAIDVGDRERGVLTTIPSLPEGYDFAKLSEYLVRVKTSYPTENHASLLLEPDVPYDVVVHVMDATRLIDQNVNGRIVRAQLFPDINLGDAPIVGAVATP